MIKIENLFRDKVVNRGGINLYSKQDAIRFVEECQNHSINILGIDGFFLTPDTTEPSIENSIDFTDLSFKKESNFEVVKEFLEMKDDNLFFEIIHE
jgi:hypothetical protein